MFGQSQFRTALQNTLNAYVICFTENNETIGWLRNSEGLQRRSLSPKNIFASIIAETYKTSADMTFFK
jgi:hypothetical protein